MTSKKIKFTFLFLSIGLIALSFVFTGFMNVSSFEKSYTESIVTNYAVLGKKAVRTISYAVKYGKPLDNFHGIEKILDDVKKHGDGIENVWIVDRDREVLYDSFGKVSSIKIDKELMDKIDFSNYNESNTFIYEIWKDSYHIFLPIYDRENNWIGIVDILFDKNIIDTKTKENIKTLGFYAVSISITAILLLLLFIYRMQITESSGEIRTKAIAILLVSVLGVSQIIYGVLSFGLLKNGYIDTANRNVFTSLEMVRQDINSVLKKGVNYEDIYSIEEWMEEIIKDVPEIGNIFISNQNNKIMFTTEKEKSSLVDFSKENTYSLLLIKDNNGIAGSVNMSISSKYIQKKSVNMILDMVTLLLTSMFFMMELSLFSIFLLRKRVYRSSKSKESFYDVNIIRTLSFLFFIGWSMASSFITLRMNELYQPIGGLSKNFVLSLPLSAQMLFGSFATLFIGDYIDRKGWKPAFFIGLVFIGIGTVLSASAWNSWIFIAARCVAGIGYGASLLSMGGFVAKTARNDDEKSKGFAANTTGIYAGSICGVAIGGMLAERIGYGNVFYVMTIALVLVGVFTFFTVKNNSKEEMIINTSEDETIEIKAASFFVQKPVISFFIFILVPLTISTFFLQYFFPIYANEMKVSSSNISRVFMLVNLIIAYIVPIVIAYIRLKLGFKKGIIFAISICALALIVFGIFPSIMLAVIAALFLGLGEGIGLNINKNYYISLEATKRLGTGKSLGYYGVVRKMAQFVGPLIFPIALSMGIGLGIETIGIVIMVCIVLFVFTNGFKKTSEKDTNLNT